MCHIDLDVHAEASILAEATARCARSGYSAIPPKTVRRLVTKVEPVAPLRVCYEAGPTGPRPCCLLTATGCSVLSLPPVSLPPRLGLGEDGSPKRHSAR